jgi:hypothetical protein
MRASTAAGCDARPLAASLRPEATLRRLSLAGAPAGSLLGDQPGFAAAREVRRAAAARRGEREGGRDTSFGLCP